MDLHNHGIWSSHVEVVIDHYIDDKTCWKPCFIIEGGPKLRYSTKAHHDVSFEMQNLGLLREFQSVYPFTDLYK